MCILKSHKNVNIWGLPLRFDIVSYLISMWHVCSNKFQFLLWLSFGSCLCEFAWCGFSLICISIYYLRKHLFHITLTMALPVGSNSWNYQQTLFKQKTAYEILRSDWSSDVCSSDLFFSNIRLHILFEKPFVPYYSNHGFAGWF